MIEIAPLAFMRGRTLTNAVVLLDEAQNTTTMQMKMFLTRLGEGSRMIVTGDPTQIDLPPGQKSGLIEAVRILSGVEGIARDHLQRGRRGAPRPRAPHRHRLRRRRGGRDRAGAQRRPRAVIELDRAGEAERWAALGDAEALARRAVEAALAVAGTRRGRRMSSSACFSPTTRPFAAEPRLARQGQGHQCSVLSGSPHRRDAGTASHLGDIALAFERWRARRRSEGKTLRGPLRRI